MNIDNTNLELEADKKEIRNIVAKNINLTTVDQFVDFHNITYLNLSRNKLTDVSKLSSLTAIQNLILCSNYISNIDFITQMKDIKRFCIAGNSISSKQQLLPLKQCKELEEIVFGCELVERRNQMVKTNANYRAVIIELCPQIVTIDRQMVEDEERQQVQKFTINNVQVLQKEYGEIKQKIEKFSLKIRCLEGVIKAGDITEDNTLDGSLSSIQNIDYDYFK
ncbi:leucine-rich_repeat-containing protein [Hexamita inflata]|uniref:Leucine-rich repeat-containing protein n=1 Tax=Hexamita inflata TaxID=28002 RepID=A0AA86U8T3_9EUKA|nr:leucine-rich repeat-containing protein [Hexamita inflata]